MIKPCNCQSKYQDDRYGRGMRVHTEGSKHSRCTVCGITKALDSGVKLKAPESTGKK